METREVAGGPGDVYSVMTAFSAEDLCRHVGAMRALARDLLGDEALAEDAVQDACLKALAPRTVAPVSLGSWLQAVVRSCAFDLRRSERRRRQRENAVAAAQPSETLSQLDVQQDLVAAVRSLGPVYRTVVWMRYFEGLSPGQIATRLGEPKKTIKTRLWRALQALRDQFDERHGGRGTWPAALAPLAHLAGGTTGPAAAIAAGAWLMQGKKVVLLVVLAATLVGGALQFWPGEPPSPGRAPGSAPAEQAASAPGDTAAAPAERLAVATSPPPSAASDAYGGLTVRVLWHDGGPAADVAVAIVAKAEPQLDRNEVRVVTDASGVARVDRLHAGDVTLASDRGGTMAALVAAGVMREVDFTLPRGVDVQGRVLDERQRGIAAATVVLVSPRSGWLGGRAVATSDPSGAFRIRSIDATWSIGALANGYAPSPLVDLEDIEPRAEHVRNVVLQLGQPGGAVAGSVVDGEGRGIAGALVVLGRGMGGHPVDGRTRESWSPQATETHGDGTFRFEGVEPGQHDIAARADGWARALGTVNCVAGEAASTRLVLARGVVVRGTVRDSDGAAVADAVVTALDAAVTDTPIDFAVGVDRAELKRPETRSDAGGRFELRGVSPGDLHLFAGSREHRRGFEGVCAAHLTAGPGAEVSWNPVLEGGKSMSVRVVDADGKPAWLGSSLLAIPEQLGNGAARTAMAERGARGLFVFPNCVEGPYTVAARLEEMGGNTQWVYLRGVRPGDPEAVLRLPAVPPKEAPAEIRGRIVDAGNRFEGRFVEVSLNTNSMMKRLDWKGDRFTATDVPPGRYFLRVTAAGQTVLVGPRFSVHPAQILELPDLQTEAGTGLRIAVRAPAGAQLGTPRGMLDDGFHFRSMQWNGTHLVGDNVTVGRHRLTLWADGWHAPPFDFDLSAGRDGEFAIDVAPATKRDIEVVMPWPEQWQRCDVALRDAEGRLVSADQRSSAGVGLSPLLWRANQPFGRFTLEVVVDGERHTWPVDFQRPAEAGEVARFSLRR